MSDEEFKIVLKKIKNGKYEMNKKIHKNLLKFWSGSIGNHLANAALYLGYVDIFDNDKNVLIRMKEDIFPSRGKWNNNIKLYHLDENVINHYD